PLRGTEEQAPGGGGRRGEMARCAAPRRRDDRDRRPCRQGTHRDAPRPRPIPRQCRQGLRRCRGGKGLGPQDDGRGDGAQMKQAAAAVSALLIAAVLGAVLLGVARRYVFAAPLSWTDELSAVLFVWAVFWTAAFAVPLREHVAFDLVLESLPAGLRRGIAIGASLA